MSSKSSSEKLYCKWAYWVILAPYEIKLDYMVSSVSQKMDKLYDILL